MIKSIINMVFKVALTDFWHTLNEINVLANKAFLENLKRRINSFLLHKSRKNTLWNPKPEYWTSAQSKKP